MSSLVTIAWMLPDGRGSGRDGERVVRVAGALPGDVVRYAAPEGGKSVDAELIELVEPSPGRRPPPCPWDARCGGCDLSALAPGARAEALTRSVAWALGFEPSFTRSPRSTAHRARIKLAIDGGRVGYRAERSHELVEVGTCAVAREEVQDALGRLRAAPPPAGVTSVEIRSDGARAVYAFSSQDGDAPAKPGKVDRDALAALGDVALDGKVVSGDPTLWLEVEGLRLRASPRSFYQVNLEVNALLVRHVRELVLARGPERVLDLYSGIGNLCLPIAAAKVPVCAVELEGQAVADLRAVAGKSGAIEIIGADVGKFDPSRTPFDVVVLDPPRAGAPGVLAKLVRQRPKAIVYVSCHLPSALRDAKEASKAGYRLTRADCFDLFPDTHHVETVLLLERG